MAKDARTHSLFYEIRDLLLVEPDEACRRIRRDRSLLRLRGGLGETLLHWMSIENVLTAVATLIELGSEIDTTNEFGSTPLQEAALLGHTELCRRLLAHGANPCHVNQAGDSVISSAAHLKRHRDLIIELFRAVPQGTPMEQLLDSSVRLGLWHRDDIVAQTFREHGLSQPSDEEDHSG